MINAIIILTVALVLVVAYAVDVWEVRKAEKRINEALDRIDHEIATYGSAAYRTGENGDIECIPFESLWKLTQ